MRKRERKRERERERGGERETERDVQGGPVSAKKTLVQIGSMY